MAQLRVTVPDEMREQVEATAAANDVTLSLVIRVALARMFDQPAPQLIVPDDA